MINPKPSTQSFHGLYIYRPQKGSWLTTADPVPKKNDPEEPPGKKVIDVSFPEATRNWSRYHKISGLKSDKEMTTD
jgi:hypothetical protein